MVLLALIPVEKEIDSLSLALEEQGLIGIEVELGRLRGRAYNNGGLITVKGGLGKAQFGIQTQHLLDHLHDVGLVVCAGTAGGLLQNLSVGDVVVATETVEHDFNRVMTKNPLPRFEGNSPYLSALKSLDVSAANSFDIHFGPVASGDEGIADNSRAKELYDATGAFAVAWEGAGGARAAAFSDVPFLEIRGISDGAGDGAIEEFYQNIPIAMKSVAQVLVSLAEMVD